MSTFSQKKVWHSHLKQKSPIRIRWKGVPRDADGTPRKSDYGDYYQCFFEVAGDDEDGYYYVCEDESILEDILTQSEEAWTIVTAVGGKDSQALDIRADDGSVQDVAPSVGAARPTKKQANRGAYSAGSLMVDYTACFEAAQEFIDERLPGEQSVEIFNITKELATTLYIQWSKGGFSVPIYPEAPAETVTIEPKVTITPTPEAVAQEEAQLVDTSVVSAKLAQLPKKNGTSHDGKQLKRVTDAMASALVDTPTNEQLAKMEFWLDAETKAQVADGELVGEYVPDDDLPF